jgi:hypothetical protein
MTLPQFGEAALFALSFGGFLLRLSRLDELPDRPAGAPAPCFIPLISKSKLRIMRQ